MARAWFGRMPQAALSLALLLVEPGCRNGPAKTVPDDPSEVEDLDEPDGPISPDDPTGQPVVPARYPRLDAPVPSFEATPLPTAIPATGTVVALWDPGKARSSENVGIRQILSTLGIPSRTVAAPSDLAGHELAIVTGELEDMADSRVKALQAAAASGTAMLLISPDSEPVEALAGATHDDKEYRQAFALTDVTDPMTDALRALGVTPMQLIGTPSNHVNTHGFTLAEASTFPDHPPEVLARFDDGAAALVRRDKVYLLGLRTSFYMNLLSGEQRGLSGPWTNASYFEGDLLPLLVRGFYASHASHPHLRQTAPGGHKAAVILTHDCDSRYSSFYIRQFLALEAAHGVHATYLVPTSTTDVHREIGPTYTQELLSILRDALAAGNDVGSHSFAHLPDFNLLPWQLDGLESAAGYQPVESAEGTTGVLTQGASLFGELAVSRWLLQADLPATVEAFRPGFLAFPKSFYESVAKVGYRRTSAQATGVVRTNFPFRGVFKAGEDQYQVQSVIEYPLGISDHLLDGANVAEKVASWLAVVDRNMVIGAPTLLLLHPTRRPGKVAALTQFLDGLASRDVWVGSLKELADFYEGQGF